LASRPSERHFCCGALRAIAEHRTASKDVPVLPEHYFEQSEGFEHRRLLLLFVDLTLVGGLALAAIARLVARPHAVLVLAACSVVLFVGSLAYLVHSEVL